MNAALPVEVLKQHLIDPEICIRCNTCEETCPIDAITHDSNNYVVDPDICNGCMACVPPCPTGSIDNWRLVVRAEAYSLQDQLGWDELPREQPLPEAAAVAQPAADAAVEPPSAAPWQSCHPPRPAPACRRGPPRIPTSISTPTRRR